MLAVLVALLGFASQAAAAVVAVRVLDASSGLPLAGQRVVIYEESAGGERTWRRADQTDATGRAQLEVPDLASGGRFIARTKPYAQWVEQVIPASGAVTVSAGRVRVDVRHGVTGAPMKGLDLVLAARGADGKYTYVAKVTTDADGSVRLDPAALGTQVYALRGPSPIDGSVKYSEPILEAGSSTFTLGSRPVTVRLTDWHSTAPLAAQRVEFRERLADGSLQWVTARQTDGDGRVRIDLDGLDLGRRYVMRTKPYLQVIEREIAEPGWFGLRAGTVPATLLNGDTGLPLADAPVTLLSRLADGGYRHEFQATTDTNGVLHFDPLRLGVEDYVLRARSTVDGSLKYSAPIRQAGAVTFAVGNRGLTVRVVDAASDTAIPALQVRAHEVLGSGALGPAINRTTDETGTARFDLDGLGAGRHYKVRTKPYLQWIERDVESAGWVDVSAGPVRATVVHGVTGKALANEAVRLYAVQADGTRKALQTLNSAADGTLILDPVDLGDRPYVLSAASPMDGTTKFSEPIMAPGEHTFAVGGAGVLVKVTDWQSKDAMPGVTVKAFDIAADGSHVWVAQRVTDELGRARFDLDGLDSGRPYVIKTRPYRQTITREVSATGFLGIRAGHVRVKVQRGDDARALANTAVKVLAVLPDGNYEHLTTLESDAAGELILDLPDLGPTQYVLRAASPIDGTLKYGPPIVRAGPVQFAVGNEALQIAFRDPQALALEPEPTLEIQADGTRSWVRQAVSDSGDSTALGAGAAFAHLTLHILELQADDTRSWVRNVVTDADGRAELDLDGLGSGRRYLVRAKPYAQWLEETVIDTGEVVIEAGSAPLELIDRDHDVPLEDIVVRALYKTADGTLSPAFGNGTTDADGIVRFDPRDLGNGRSVVYVAVDPFATGVNYFSPPSVVAGPTTLAVARSGPQPLDRTPAELAVDEPRSNQAVSSTAVVISGHAYDRVGLSSVMVEVRNGTTLIGHAYAEIDRDTQRWTAHVYTPDAVPGMRLTATVTATDTAYNATTSSRVLRTVADDTPPTVLFRSPAEASTTNGQGILVLGTVNDDTQWAALAVRLEDEARVLAPYRAVELDPVSGDWALAIPSDTLRTVAGLTIRARATDVSGNVAEATRTLTVNPDGDSLRHLLSRITFGESPELYDEARRIGGYAYLLEQLTPGHIDDSALDARLQALPLASLGDLRQRTLLRMAMSRRQLNEVMTWFWDNHFNTDFRQHGRYDWEAQENDAFRTHALGRFRDVLAVSAHSPAMLRYLDNARSHKRDPNENYARELLELHTLGSGYSQHDIEELARAFSGWTLSDDRFAFDAKRHDDGEKRLLGITLAAGGGEQDGETLLDLLAAHPATARHLCHKLAQLFVADGPPAELVDRCTNTYLAHKAAPDQIARVVRTLVSSTEFRAAEHRGAKAKTSLEFLIGLVRGTQALGTGVDLARIADTLGQPLFNYPVPTGYSLDARDWTGPHMLRQRLVLIGQVLESAPTGKALRADPNTLLAGTPEVKTTEGVAARVLQNALGGSFDAAELALAIDVLTDQGTRRFALDARDGPERLQRLARSVLSLPRYQLR